MAVIANTVEIERPIEEVFDFTADLRSELKWNPNVESIEKIDHGRTVWPRYPIPGIVAHASTRHYGMHALGASDPVRLLHDGPIEVDLTITLRPTSAGRHPDQSLRGPAAQIHAAVVSVCLRT